MITTIAVAAARAAAGTVVGEVIRGPKALDARRDGIDYESVIRFSADAPAFRNERGALPSNTSIGMSTGRLPK